VEREEFVNVGVVLFAREQGFLDARIHLDAPRLCALAPEVDVGAIQRHLEVLGAVCAGLPEGGPIANLPAPDRFHWLVAPRSTMIQTSPVHVGRTTDPREALEHLFARHVSSSAS
jgi:hypothetical protein